MSLLKKYKIRIAKTKWRSRKNSESDKKITLIRTFKTSCLNCKFNSLYGNECRYYSFTMHMKSYQETVSLWYFCDKFNNKYRLEKIEDVIKT